MAYTTLMKSLFTFFFIIFAACIVLGIFCVTGCKPIEAPVQSDSYTTDVATSPELYVMRINKEIEPITNMLVTQMGLADKVVAGEYPVVDAIDSVKAAITSVEDSKAVIESTLPPSSYAYVRENTLQSIVNILNTLNAYKDELSSSNFSADNVKQLRNIMEGDFMTLTENFNVYNK